MDRLFAAELGTPAENARGAIDLRFKQIQVKDELEVALSGRGFQQMLLIFACLYSHKRSVLYVEGGTDLDMLHALAK